MSIVTADDCKRVEIPDAKPGQSFAYQDNGDGSFTFTLLNAERKEPFPPGSLAKYFTVEKNKEELELLKGCVAGPSADE